jgi:hypothetical protein
MSVATLQVSLLDPLLPYGVLIGCLNAYKPPKQYHDRSQLWNSTLEREADAALYGGADGDGDDGSGADGGGNGVGVGGGGGADGGRVNGGDVRSAIDPDPLLSPLGADDALLKRLPPISLAGVLLDPLLDDCVVRIYSFCRH